MKQTGILLIVAVCVVALLYYLTADRGPGQYDDFAKCLTEKGISMGGTNTCTYCKQQKEMFGKSFKYVDYKNCDYEREWCVSNGVRRFPTWVFPDGKAYTGLQNLKALSTLSGCEL